MSYQFGTVDVIGLDSVAKLIKQSKLPKFIIFKGGATQGSIPVFRNNEAKTVEQSIQCFRDWAESVLRMNPNNNLPYEIYIHSPKVDEEAIRGSLKKKKGDDDDEEDIRTKRDRIRFSFSLNPYSNSMNGDRGVSAERIGEIIKKTLDERETVNELKRLREENEALRSGRLSRDDDDDDFDDEEEEEDSPLEKVYKVIKELNRSELIKKGHFAEAAGDDDDDDDEMDGDDEAEVTGDDEEEEAGEDVPEEKPAPKDKVADANKKLDRMKAALKILWKYDQYLDRDLMSLAKVAEKHPKMFKNYMETLRNMDL